MSRRDRGGGLTQLVASARAGYGHNSATNQMIQRRAKGIRPLARISQTGSLAQQFQRSLVQRRAVSFRQTADAVSQFVVETPDPSVDSRCQPQVLQRMSHYDAICWTIASIR